jgi:DNA repair protein RecO (recombination protein O)
MPLEKTAGFVLQSRNLGEADKIVTFFTQRWGKISAIAKGVRKSKRRPAVGLDLLAYSELHLYGREHSQLPVLSQWEVKSAFYDDYEKYPEKFLYLSYLAEFVRELSPEKQRNGLLFSLIEEVLFLIKQSQERAEIENLICFFELNGLKALGHQPKVDRCIKCGEGNFKPPLRFSLKGGGVLCATCSSSPFPSFPVHPATIKIMDHFLRVPAEKIRRLKIAPVFVAEYKNLFSLFIKYHFDKKFKSLSWGEIGKLSLGVEN